MTVTISAPIFITVLTSILATSWSFREFTGGSGNDYGIGGLIAIFLSGFVTMFCVAVMFAGAYLGWWKL